MDPFTQGIVGAIAGQASAKTQRYRAATIIGGLSAMSADLDIFLRSSTDPLLALEMHRHFTHSLFFIPIGGAICAAFFWLILRKWKFTFRELFIWATAGYATAGLIDLFTTYGTAYLLPFSNARYSWDNMPIIDPVFSFVLLVLGAFAFSWRKKKLTHAACLFFITYSAFGFWQKHRAATHLETLAAERGHTIERLRVMPAPLSLLLWRGIYKTGDTYVSDGFWLGYLGGSRHYPGTQVPAITPEDFDEALPPDSTQGKDIRRFNQFTQNWLFHAEDAPDTLGDFRYALFPESKTPLWGIRINPDAPDTHIERVRFERTGADRWQRFTSMLKGEDTE